MAGRSRVAGWAFLLAPLLALALARGLWAPDEPRYAEVAKEAFESGELLVLHLNGSLYPDKPPLVYWLAGLCGAAFGWEEFALRVPSIVATVLSALLIARLARRWLGDEEARWAPFFFLGSALPLWMGARLQLDPVLACCVLAAIERLARDGDRRALFANAAWAGVYAGLGALAKGPVAWLHVGLAILAWRLAPGAARFAPARGARAWTLAGLLAIAPVALWAALASWREPALFRALFLEQHLGRVSADAPHHGPPWKYVGEFPLYLAPTTLLVAAGLALAWRGFRAARAGASSADEAARNELGTVRIALWLALAFAVFSALPPKRDVYLLPLYPAAALLAARAFAHGLRAGALPAWVARGTPALLLTLAAALLIAPWIVPEAREFARGSALAALPLSAGALAAYFLPAPAHWARAQWLGLAAAIVVASATVLPAVDAVKSPRALAERLAARPERPSTVWFLAVQPEGYQFYAKVPGEKIEQPGGDVNARLRSELARQGAQFLLVARVHEYECLAPDVRARMHVLERTSVGSRDVLVLGAVGAHGGAPRARDAQAEPRPALR